MTYDNEVGGGAHHSGAMGNASLSAMFDSHDDAQRAVDRLVQAGVPMAQIRMVSGGSDTGATKTARTDEDKGFWDSLSDFFFPDEDRYAYAEGLSRGGYLVTVTGLGSAQYDQALDILDDEGSVDLDERTESWRSEGWGGYESSSYASTGGAMAGGTLTGGTTTGARTGDLDAQMEYGARTDARSDEDVIPVIEERIRVGKRDTSHGRVRVRAYTVEEPVSESIDLREERVEIERRPVDRAVSGADAAFQDRTLEAQEYREEAVVEKEARVVEEIGLRKTTDTHRETISDTVRRTEVEVEDDRDGLDTTRRDRGDDRIV